MGVRGKNDRMHYRFETRLRTRKLGRWFGRFGAGIDKLLSRL